MNKVLLCPSAINSVRSLYKEDIYVMHHDHYNLIHSCSKATLIVVKSNEHKLKDPVEKQKLRDLLFCGELVV